MPSQNFENSANVTIPAGVTVIDLFMWGAGGGGGGTIDPTESIEKPAGYSYGFWIFTLPDLGVTVPQLGTGGAGGSAGAVGYWRLTVIPGATYNLVIGARGLAGLKCNLAARGSANLTGTSFAGRGQEGGDTTFGRNGVVLARAQGGGGGECGNLYGQKIANSGLGGACFGSAASRLKDMTGARGGQGAIWQLVMNPDTGVGGGGGAGGCSINMTQSKQGGVGKIGGRPDGGDGGVAASQGDFPNFPAAQQGGPGAVATNYTSFTIKKGQSGGGGGGAGYTFGRDAPLPTDTPNFHGNGGAGGAGFAMIRSAVALAMADPVNKGNITFTFAVEGLTFVFCAAAHGLSTGDHVTIFCCTNNTDANGSWEIVVTDNTTFYLVGLSSSMGGSEASATWEKIQTTYTSGTVSNISAGGTLSVSSASGLTTGDSVKISGCVTIPACNGIWTVTMIDNSHFSIPLSNAGGSESNATWVKN